MTSLNSSDRKRLAILGFSLAALFCLLIVRFYQIQIVQGDHWKQVALSQHECVETIPCMRGSFYSNTSIKKGHPEDAQPFVIDVQKFHLYIDPDSIPSQFKQAAAERLYFLLELAESDWEWLVKEVARKSRSRKIGVWLDPKKKEEIEAWWAKFSRQGKIARNALYFVADYQRSYPFGSMLGTVLHTVQEERDPATGEAVPTGGLELAFNRVLQGKKGKRLLTRSPRHPLGAGKILEAPENGADIYLTINHYLQAIVESELSKGVTAANAKGGWAAMMDPYTGEILALAQTPVFNPARYRDYYNDPALQETTKVKAVTDCFEPGSIFKALACAVYLQANDELQRTGQKPIFLPEEWIPCANGWFPGRSAPLKDARVYPFMNLDVAIQKSSNIYVARLMQRAVETMGDEWIRSAFVNLFGFGKKTGLELPAESVGLVPRPGKLHPNGRLEWSIPTPYSLAMGHNILVNSIQVARAYAILSNGGFEVTPHLIRKIVKGGDVLVDNTGKNRGRQVMKSEISRRVVRAMKFVTKEGGTGKRADIMGYTEAGKSGTAEKVIDGIYAKQKNISSFAGFAPAENPRFVLVVSVDEPEVKLIPGVGKHQYGGVCVAPIFREIGTRALEYLGVTPDDPYGYPVGDPRRNGEMADMMKEIKALKEAYEVRNSSSR